MKKIVLAIMAAALVSTSAMAQTTTEKKQKPQGDRTEMMVKELGLSDAQATKVKALNKKYEGKMGQPQQGRQKPSTQKSSAKSSSSSNSQRPERPQMTDEQKQNMQAYEKELKAILTDDQYTTYQNARKQGPKKGNQQK